MGFSEVLPCYVTRSMSLFSGSHYLYRRCESSRLILNWINTCLVRYTPDHQNLLLTRACFKLRAFGRSPSDRPKGVTKLSYVSTKFATMCFRFWIVQKNKCIAILCLRWYDLFCPANSWHSIHGPTVDKHVILSFFTFLKKQTIVACESWPSIASCINTLRVKPVQEINFSVTRWPQSSWSNWKLWLSFIYYPSCCLETAWIFKRNFIGIF